MKTAFDLCRVHADGRCAHCRRRVGANHCGLIGEDGVTKLFCHDRAGCRRAWHADGTGELDLTCEPDSITVGTALRTADYITWPWWCRILPRGRRDELANRFAWLYARAEAGRRARSTEPDSR